jgi:hypothetical protein
MCKNFGSNLSYTCVSKLSLCVYMANIAIPTCMYVGMYVCMYVIPHRVDS